MGLDKQQIIKYSELLNSTYIDLDKQQIIKYSELLNSTYIDLSSYRYYFVTLPILGLYN